MAWFLGATATTRAGLTQATLLMAMIVTFALAECLYSPAFYSLVGQQAANGAVGRTSGATWAVYSVGGMIGPSILATTTIPDPVRGCESTAGPMRPRNTRQRAKEAFFITTSSSCV